MTLSLPLEQTANAIRVKVMGARSGAGPTPKTLKWSHLGPLTKMHILKNYGVKLKALTRL